MRFTLFSSSALREARECWFAGLEFQGSDIKQPLKDQLVEKTAAEKDKQMPQQANPEANTAELVKTSNDVLAKHGEAIKDFPPAVKDQMKNAIIRYVETTVGNFDINNVNGLSVEEFRNFLASMVQAIEEQLNKVAESRKKGQNDVEAQKAKEQKKQEEADKKKKSFDELNNALKEKVLKIQLQKLDMPPKPDLKDPEAVESFTEKVKLTMGVYQKNVSEVQKLQGEIAERAQDISLLFEKGQAEMAAQNKIVQGAGASGAAALGAIYGAPFFGFGAIVGAAIGTLLYGGAAALVAETQRKENERRAAQMNNEIAEAKKVFDTARNDVKQNETEMVAQGAQVNGLSEPVQSDLQALLSPKQEELNRLNAEIQTADAQRQATLAPIERQLKELPDTPEGRAKRTQLLVARSKVIATLDVDAGKRSKSKAELEAFLGQGNNLRNALQQSDAQVAKVVLDGQLSIAQGNIDLDAASKQLTELKTIEAPSTFAKLLSGFEGLGNTAKFVLADVVAPVFEGVSDFLKNVPLLHYPLSFPLDIVSGLAEGSGELAHGLGTLAAHPIEGAEGLLKIVSGDSEAWTQLRKAFIAEKEFREGEIGKGAGKVFVNLLLTATGLGAAGAGGRGLSLAYRTARNNGSTKLSSAVRGSLSGAKAGTVEFAKGLAKIPGNVLYAGGKVLSAPVQIGRRLRGKRVAAQEAKVEAAAGEGIAGQTTELNVIDDLTEVSPSATSAASPKAAPNRGKRAQDLLDGKVQWAETMKLKVKGEKVRVKYLGEENGVFKFVDAKRNYIEIPRAKLLPKQRPAPITLPGKLGEVELGAFPTLAFESGGVDYVGRILCVSEDGATVSVLFKQANGRYKIVNRPLDEVGLENVKGVMGQKNLPDLNNVRIGRNPETDFFVVRNPSGTYRVDARPRVGPEPVPVAGESTSFLGGLKERLTRTGRQARRERAARRAVEAAKSKALDRVVGQQKIGQRWSTLEEAEKGLADEIASLKKQLETKRTPADTIYPEAFEIDMATRSSIFECEIALNDVRTALALEKKLAKPAATPVAASEVVPVVDAALVELKSQLATARRVALEDGIIKDALRTSPNLKMVAATIKKQIFMLENKIKQLDKNLKRGPVENASQIADLLNANKALLTQQQASLARVETVLELELDVAKAAPKPIKP